MHLTSVHQGETGETVKHIHKEQGHINATQGGELRPDVSAQTTKPDDVVHKSGSKNCLHSQFKFEQSVLTVAAHKLTNQVSRNV